MIARLVEARELAPGTRHFVFAVEGVEFRYEPGQFVSLVKKLGDDEITRAYSIASAPDGNHFTPTWCRTVDLRRSCLEWSRAIRWN